MKTFTTNCDVGSIRIFTRDLAMHFSNGVGDMPTGVTIREKKDRKVKKDAGEFIGMFNVRTPSTVFLSAYDCADQPIYVFGVGRWFVYQLRGAKLNIEYLDDKVE